jgi:predicted ATPase/DNA-binding SARP family transcriptional activator
LTIFRILGPVEVAAGGQPIRVGGRRQLKLLAFLMLNANRAVSADALVEAVWDPAKPGASNRLPMAITRLRRALAPINSTSGAVLRTVSGGYLLSVLPGELDADVFRERVREGRRALEHGDALLASDLLGQALELWRGPPLAEVAFEDFAQPEIRQLEQLRLTALETRADADLQQGRHAELIGELEALLAEDPTRERLAAQLMTALYRSGRQTDALAVYQHTRRHLVQELGLDPGPALQSLHSQILQHAESLQEPVRSNREDHRPSKRGPDGGADQAGVFMPQRVRPLPWPPTATIGRRREIEEVSRLLADPGTRLVTVTGPGGVGKTRLALEIARAIATSFPDDACWVGLGGVTSPADVGPAILRALAEVPLPGEDAIDALRRYLARLQMLLVLDNFEHVLDAAPLLADLHDACARLTLLVTSREALNLTAEHRIVLSPLSVPSSSATVSDIESTDATALFVAAARRHDSRFTTAPTTAAVIAQICARLDGLPLALELAAALTSTLGVKELAGRLEEAMTGLGTGPRDAPSRQRTLATTIDWSYQLLDDELRRTFAHFAVFAGGATLQSAQEVTGADLHALEALISKSLIDLRRQADGSSRLVMLETVQQHALQRLERDSDQDVISERHLKHYAMFLERATSRFSTHDEQTALEEVDREIDNIRAALRWGMRSKPAAAVRLVGHLGDYWQIRGESNVLPFFEASIELAGDRAPLADRARAELRRARLLRLRQQHDAASEGTDRALALYRRVGDHAGVSQALIEVAAHASLRGERTRAQKSVEAACKYARLANDNVLLGAALTWLASYVPSDDGAALFEEGSRLLVRAGADRHLAHAHNNRAFAALIEGRAHDALALLESVLPAVERLGSPTSTMFMLGNIGLANLLLGNLDPARDAFERQLKLCRGQSFRYGADEGVFGLAALAANEGQAHRAAKLLGAARTLGYPQVGDQPIQERIEREFFAPARTATDTIAWLAAERAGEELSYDEAIAYALDELRSGATNPLDTALAI